MAQDPRDVANSLPERLRRAARALGSDLNLYFVEDSEAVVVPIKCLRLTRARPDGITSAIGRMAEAAAGLRERRPPIRVADRHDGLLDVVDGNSTVVAAAAAGWTEVRCRRDG